MGFGQGGALSILGGPAPSDTAPIMDESLGMPRGLAGVPSSVLATPAPTPPDLAPLPSPAPTEHQSRIGKAIQSILGTQVDYQVQPDGTTVAVPIKATGSSIFRGILAGALLGAEAGQAAHNQNPDSGAIAGVGAGGAAAVRYNIAMDAQRRERAENDFKQQMLAKRASREDTLMQAQIAKLHSEVLATNAHLDLANQEFIDNKNSRDDIRGDKFRQANGVVTPILVGGKNINGQPGNGKDIIAAGPNALMADVRPDSIRMHTQYTDTSGLKYEAGRGWVDPATDKPVDLDTRTTHTFYDVPMNSYKSEGSYLTNKELNKLYGRQIYPEGDHADDKRYIPFVDQTAIATSAEEYSNKTQREKLQNQLLRFQIAHVQQETAQLKDKLNQPNAQALRGELAVLTEQGRMVGDAIKAKEKEIQNNLGAASEADKQELAELKEAEKQVRANLTGLNNQYIKMFGIQNATSTATTAAGSPAPSGFTDETWKTVPSNIRDVWATAAPEEKAFWAIQANPSSLQQKLGYVDQLPFSDQQKAGLKKRIYEAAGIKAPPTDSGGFTLPATETVGGVPYTPQQAAADRAASAAQRQKNLQQQQAADQQRAEKF